MDSRFSKSIAQVNSRDIQCQRQIKGITIRRPGGAAPPLERRGLRALRQPPARWRRAGEADVAPTPGAQVLHPEIRRCARGFTGREAELAAVEAALWTQGRHWRRGANVAATSAAVKGAGRGWQVGAGAGVRLAQPRTLPGRVVDQGGEGRDAARRPDRVGRAVHSRHHGRCRTAQRRRMRALGHIAQMRAGKPWLLVYDNVEQPGDIEKLDAGGAALHVLITTRWSDWGRGGVAGEDRRVSTRCRGAVSAGQHRAGLTGRSAEQLAAALGYPAAGARSCGGLLPGAPASPSTRYRDACRRFDPQRAERRPTTHEETPVFATFELGDPEGGGGRARRRRKLMGICAFLAPERIRPRHRDVRMS